MVRLKLHRAFTLHYICFYMSLGFCSDHNKHIRGCDLTAVPRSPLVGTPACPGESGRNTGTIMWAVNRAILLSHVAVERASVQVRVCTADSAHSIFCPHPRRCPDVARNPGPAHQDEPEEIWGDSVSGKFHLFLSAFCASDVFVPQKEVKTPCLMGVSCCKYKCCLFGVQ